MTTLENRPNTALLVVDVQNGVVEAADVCDAIVANVGSLVERRGGNGFPSSGSSIPTSSSRGAATTGGSCPS
jgi:hypothetical protein